MKLTIPPHNTESTRNIMRRLGYFENFDRHTGKTSYIKRISRESFYPRFHVYIAESQSGRIIDLHLDQKQPSYAGSHAHNAEYDSAPVKNEAGRMRGILENMEAVGEEKLAEEKKEIGLWDKFMGIFRGN